MSVSATKRPPNSPKYPGVQASAIMACDMAAGAIDQDSSEGGSSPVSFVIASRLEAIKPSATLGGTARAAKIRAAGKDVIGLGAGEADFDTAPHIKDAATGGHGKVI